MDYEKDFYDLCDMISDQLVEAKTRLKSAGGKINNQDAEYIDKLTHSLKSLKCTIGMMEDEGYSSRGSYDGGMSGRSYRDGSYRGGSYDGSYDNGGSYARGRGRGRNAKRDSMGRYSREGGYSSANEMVSDLQELMENAPDDRTRQEFQRFISKMEQM